jgi:hypothetical protein
MTVRAREPASRQFSIKVGSQELDRISQARKNLDDIKTLAQFAARYQKLGWSPVALEGHAGADLKVDFRQPDTTWINFLMDLALQEIPVRLALRLEPQASLFVFRMHAKLVKDLEASLGDWRSACIARCGDAWEHHFLVLPPTWHFAAENPADDSGGLLSVVRPGNLVLAPPSRETSSLDLWRWINSPWEQPPGHPCPEILILLESCGFIFGRNPKAADALPDRAEMAGIIRPADALPPAAELTAGGSSGPPEDSSPEDPLPELPPWAAKILELEQRLSNLELSPLSPRSENPADFPPGREKQAPPPQKAWRDGLPRMPADNLAELQELLSSMDKFLEEHQDLSDPDTLLLLQDCYSMILRLVRSGAAPPEDIPKPRG